MGEVRQEEEHQEADPTMASPSTIISESASLARAFTNEPVRTEATSTSGAVDDRAPATQVVGEGDAPPLQTSTGNPLAFTHLSQNFCFLELDL